MFPITNDEDENFLTPGHFLIGRPLVSAPEPIFDENITPRCRWNRLRDMIQSFWRLWSQQILHQEMQRKKWQKATSNIRVGQVVLVPDNKSSPGTWPLGVVQSLITGSQNTVRTVQVRLSNRNVVLRAVNRLVIIPVEATKD